MSWKAFKNKWIWYTREPNKNGTYEYTSVWDLDTDLRTEAFLQKIVYFFKYRLWRPVYDFPGDARMYTKHWYQRANRGWSDRDTWSFDGYLAATIAGGLKHLKKHKHGVPMGAFPEVGEPGDFDEHGNHTDQAMEKATKEWDRILDTIIFTFETELAVQDRNLLMPKDGADAFTEEEVAQWQKFCDEMNAKYPEDKYRMATPQEIARHKLGWKYFQKFFGNLWD